jgi:hypothetical protein
VGIETYNRGQATTSDGYESYLYSRGFSFTASVCAPASVEVIPSTAKVATPTITPHTVLFILPTASLCPERSRAAQTPTQCPGQMSSLNAFRAPALGRGVSNATPWLAPWLGAFHRTTRAQERQTW